MENTRIPDHHRRIHSVGSALNICDPASRKANECILTREKSSAFRSSTLPVPGYGLAPSTTHCRRSAAFDPAEIYLVLGALASQTPEQARQAFPSGN